MIINKLYMLAHMFTDKNNLLNFTDKTNLLKTNFVLKMFITFFLKVYHLHIAEIDV